MKQVPYSILILILLSLLLFSCKDHSSKMQENRINHTTGNMIQIAQSIIKSKLKYPSLYDYYKSNVLSTDLLFSPLTPANEYSSSIKSMDKGENVQLSEKEFNTACGYKIKHNKSGKLILWDRYHPQIKIIQSDIPNSKGYYFKFQGLPKFSHYIDWNVLEKTQVPQTQQKTN